MYHFKDKVLKQTCLVVGWCLWWKHLAVKGLNVFFIYRLAHEDIVLFIRSMYSIQRCENLQENVVSFQNLIGRELKYTACSYLLNQDVESLKWFIQISSEEIQLHLNGYIAACVSLVARLSGLSNWRYVLKGNQSCPR